MTNLLFVSISFPPKNDPECLQTARYFKYLAQSNQFNIDVVTSQRPTLFMPEDASLYSYLQGYRQLIELPLWETKTTSFALRKAGLGSLLFPDSKMTFHWQSRKVTRKLKQAPDVIYSRSNPMSSAFMAQKLKRYYSVPWILHMSDPWMLSPLKENEMRDIVAEYNLLRDADMITFTTEPTRQLYAKQYPDLKDRFAVFPNVFDPDDRKDVPAFHNSKLRMVYTGGLSGQRSLSFLDKVLEQINSARPELLNQFEIVVAGPMDRPNRNYFANNRFDCLKHLGELSYQEALQLQRESNLLLVVDNPTSGSDAIFFPSKLLDYFLAGHKIVAITPQESTTRQILDGYPSQCFTHAEMNELALYLIGEIENKEKQKHSIIAPPQKFSAKVNADQLASTFRSLTKNE